MSEANADRAFVARKLTDEIVEFALEKVTKTSTHRNVLESKRFVNGHSLINDLYMYFFINLDCIYEFT